MTAALTAGTVVLTGLGFWWNARASDHDDGVSDLKTQATNLTDLYVFREDWQSGAAGDAGNLIFIMNSNPRSLPHQQYFFSTQARYEFHVTRVAAANIDTAPTGGDDVILRFEFAEPDAGNNQAITLTVVKDGVAAAPVSAGNTVDLVASLADTVPGTDVSVGGSNLHVFAGLREDPFFFDVESFFRVRGGAQGAFLATNQAPDFTAGFNVNAIVARVPISFLQSTGGSETAFDVWETISVPVDNVPNQI